MRGLRIVTAHEFASVDEPGAEPLLGAGDAALIPEGGAVMFYGTGGAGKTTLMLDLACHLAAGEPWLGVEVPRRARVLLIENEGPRALFRAKLLRKLAGWQGPPIGDWLQVHEGTEPGQPGLPWAALTFANEDHRELLAAELASRAIDVVAVGPLTASGMEAAGTLQDTRYFLSLLADVRARAGRPLITYLLAHHENRGGQVSGAWEASGDSLLHVQAQGHGRTRVYLQKVRWSSEHHQATWQLTWADNDGYATDEQPELSDSDVADMILTAIAEAPGTGWGKVEEATPGVNRQRRRQVRDGLFGSGLILNLGKRKDGDGPALDHCPEAMAAKLYLATDPACAQLRPAPGADGYGPEQLRPAHGYAEPGEPSTDAQAYEQPELVAPASPTAPTETRETPHG